MKRSEISRNLFKVPMLAKVSGMALVLAVSLMSCDKDEDIAPIEDKAQVGVLNLLSDGTELNAHLEESKINTTAIKAGEFTYFVVDAGQAGLSLFEAGETDTLAAANHLFKAGESFSVLVFGDKDDSGVLIATDDLTAPAQGKAKIRFVNFLPGESTLDLWAEDAEEALQSGAAYQTVKSFTEVTPSADLTLQVRATGSEEVLAELAEAQLEIGKTYTIFVATEAVDGVETAVLRMVTN